MTTIAERLAAAGIEVKPLEWSEGRNGELYVYFDIGSGFSGNYRIWPHGAFDMWEAEFDIICHEFGAVCIWRGTGRENGIKAVNDHNTARILSALQVNAMNAADRIFVGEDVISRSDEGAHVTFDPEATHLEYILATPEALAASPEVQALRAGLKQMGEMWEANQELLAQSKEIGFAFDEVDALKAELADTQAKLARVSAAARAEAEALDAYERTPADRGGKSGPKGKAHARWIDARTDMIAALERAKP